MTGSRVNKLTCSGGTQICRTNKKQIMYCGEKQGRRETREGYTTADREKWKSGVKKQIKEK